MPQFPLISSLGSELVPYSLVHHCSLMLLPAGLNKDASVLMESELSQELEEGEPRLHATGKGQQQLLNITRLVKQS